MPKTPDITAVINGHEEGRLLHATICSAQEAIVQAERDGLSVELLLVLDRPDDATSSYCRHHLPDGARLIETSVGDLGLARNCAIDNASGEFVAFLDGDDLWGSAWLAASHRYCQGIIERAVLHPSTIVYFEKENATWQLQDQRSKDYSDNLLFESNLWPALCFAPRKIFEEVPYRASDLTNGFGLEDWLWHCDTVAAGITHMVVPETVFCIRKKSWKPSLLNRSANANCTIADSKLFAFAWK